MTVGQMESKLAQAKNAQNSQDRALLCRLLLEDAIGFIYEKAGVEFPKKASLLELIDGLTVSSYINDSDTISTVFVKRKCEQKGPKKVSTFSTRFHVVSNVFPKYQMLTF